MFASNLRQNSLSAPLPCRNTKSTLTWNTLSAMAGASLFLWHLCHGFSINKSLSSYLPRKRNSCSVASTFLHRPVRSSQLHIYAPPGSGYIRDPQNPDPNDPYALTREELDLICPPPFPSTYEPMLEFPGTMRPGRTPENMPYHDLPGLNVDDPEPIPWPHFQEIEWHHQWAPPHEQPIQMEDFIESKGRWTSVEDEAEMRMGMRRDVRERREMEESDSFSGSNAMIIMDDAEEDENSSMMDIPSMMGLGDGVKDFIGGRNSDGKMPSKKTVIDEDDNDTELDDILYDLGLADETDEKIGPAKLTTATSKLMAASDEDDENIEMDPSLDEDDLDFELGFDLDDEEIELDLDDDLDGATEEGEPDFEEDDVLISIDDLNAKDDTGDEDDFDDGGFDYDD